MPGTIVNSIAIVAGSAAGRLLGKRFPARTAETVMKVLGLCTLYIGISGALNGADTLIVIVSMVLGTLIGETLDLDGAINRLGRKIQDSFRGDDDKDREAGTGKRENNLAEGFVNATMLFCTGSMAIMGSLDAGLRGDYSILFSKSLLDGTFALIYSTTIGIGTALSAVSVLIYQGSITILARLLAPYLNDVIITNVCCAGSIMIMAIGLNVMGVTKLRVMNCMPAVLVIIPLCILFL